MQIGTASIPGAEGTVRRTLQYVWQTDNDDTATLVAATEEALDGRRSWTSRFGRVSAAETVVDALAAPPTRVETATAPDGTYTVSRHESGRLVSVTRYAADDSVLAAVIYGYDAHGRQFQTTDSRGGTTTTLYDAADRIVSVTGPDPDGDGPQPPQTTSFAYDSRGRRVLVTNPDGGVIHTSYWPAGEVRRVWGTQNAGGTATSLTYPVETSYDSQGRRRTLTTWQDFDGDSGRAVTTWNYSAQRGWLVSKLYSDDTGPAYTYTAGGRLLSRTWARGITTSYVYDSAGRLTGVDYPNDPDVAHAYDRAGRRISTTDGTGTMTFTLEQDGQTAAETFAAAGTDLSDFVLTRSYDAVGRATGYGLTLDGATAAAATYTYGSDGRLRTVSDGGNVFTYSYVAGEPGLVAGIAVSNGTSDVMSTTKTYDGLNRLLEISQGTGAAPGSVVSSHAYHHNDAGQRVRATLADGSYWVYAYDALGQVIGGVRHESNGVVLPGMTFGYSFDDIGNRRTALEGEAPAAPSDYTASLLNQYTQRTVPGVAHVRGSAHPQATVTVTPGGGTPVPARRQDEAFYAAMPFDNAAAPVESTVTVTGVRLGLGPDGQDVVSEESRPVRIAQSPEVFTYDLDGNLLTDGLWAYTWDDENRLVAITPTGPAAASRSRLEFTYDSQSRRVRRTVHAWVADHWQLAADQQFVWDGWLPIAEAGTDHTQTPPAATARSFLWGLDLSGSLQGAGGVGGLLSITRPASPGHPVFVAYDGNGNVMALIDAETGAVAAEYHYSPFGETLKAAGPAAEGNPFRFSTKYSEAASGPELYYYGHRFYSPGLGRWLSRDPIGEEGGPNLHSLGADSPLNAFDYLGLWVPSYFPRDSSEVDADCCEWDAIAVEACRREHGRRTAVTTGEFGRCEGRNAYRVVPRLVGCTIGCSLGCLWLQVYAPGTFWACVGACEAVCNLGAGYLDPGVEDCNTAQELDQRANNLWAKLCYKGACTKRR